MTTAAEIPERTARKWAAVQGAVAREGLDAFLVASPANLAYVCGFHTDPLERLILLVVAAEGPLRLVVPSLEEHAARAAAPDDSLLFVWADADGPRAALERALAELAGAVAVGIEKATLSVATYELLLSLLPGSRFADCGPSLSRLRAVKDADEIERLRGAARIVDRALARLVAEELRPGRTELELAGVCSRLLREEGGARLAFEPAVLSGPRAAFPHYRSGDVPLAEGALVVVDIGVVSEGYCADLTRTFVLGEASEEQKRLFELVEGAREAALALIRPGVRCADVDRAARNVIEEAGYGELFIHRTGHGLGLEVHEPPSLAGSNEDLLREGMAITVEPGIYVPGLGGVRLEDDVVVTAAGAELLTHAPIELELRSA